MKARNFRIRALAAAAVLYCVVCAGAVAMDKNAAAVASVKGSQASQSQASFERIKKLVGEWTMAGGDGSVAVTYKVTAAGSAVLETLFPGSDHEMVTVYHMDGKDLVLTHYCAAGNEPRMKLAPGSAPDQLQFTFTGAGNLKSPLDVHMHEAAIKFLDDDRIHSEWVMYEGGKKKDVKSFDLARKKS